MMVTPDGHLSSQRKQTIIIMSLTVALFLQVPRFYSRKQISGLEWGSNPHTHISGVMLYQLSYMYMYQALGSKVVGRIYTKRIQALVLGAHSIRLSYS